jgi:hypothetical protein
MGPLAQLFLSPAQSQDTAGRLVLGSLGGTTASLQSPPICPQLLEWLAGPSPMVGDRAMAPCALPPLGLPGQQAWQLSAPSSPGGSGSGPRTAALPGPDSVLWWQQWPSSGNPRGAGFGSRGPSLLFHKPGPSQEQCRT